MPFDPVTVSAGPVSAGSVRRPRSVAIIGAGIAGLGAALRLADTHHVTVFEAEKRIGGHARTIIAGRRERVAVDTGFIVFNRATYPRLCALFEELKVPVKQSDMSFSASIDNGRVEYSSDSLASLFAQKRNIVSPAFLAMTRDILRFNALARDPANDTDAPLREWLEGHRLGAVFADDYLKALAGAIWSASPAQMLEFPAGALLRFFRNHKLVSLRDAEPWLTVDGGSVEYVCRVAAALRRRGATIRTGARIECVTRGLRVALKPQGGEWEQFDAVVLACHSDQALALLADASDEEIRALGALRYSKARVVLHDDASHMPRRRICWSSWNARRVGDNASVTYWMNRLQGLPPNTPLFATLNPLEPIAEASCFDEVVFAHPIVDCAAMEAQRKLPLLQGQRATFFCGAYTQYGFHEDGLMSGQVAADAVLRAPVAA